MRHIGGNEMTDLARRVGFTIASDEVDEFHTLTEAMFETFERFLALPDAPPVVAQAFLRDPGRARTSDEDPFNDIRRWCRVKDEKAAEGPLSGIRVALKDMSLIAGVPLTYGSSDLRTRA